MYDNSDMILDNARIATENNLNIFGSNMLNTILFFGFIVFIVLSWILICKDKKENLILLFTNIGSVIVVAIRSIIRSNEILNIKLVSLYVLIEWIIYIVLYEYIYKKEKLSKKMREIITFILIIISIIVIYFVLKYMYTPITIY